MSFFTLESGEDGPYMTIHENKDELLQYIQENDLHQFRTCVADNPLRTSSHLETWTDNDCMIIKGEIIVPKPKETVINWDFES